MTNDRLVAAYAAEYPPLRLWDWLEGDYVYEGETERCPSVFFETLPSAEQQVVYDRYLDCMEEMVLDDLQAGYLTLKEMYEALA